ncbi:uncharacterized protein LOC126907214 [Daktulosphaira vitifoliae]|uniref:uncharacterized protein LOC126907214 n=1 Tax=Daktulosphaira vitifoliae TaxID=58002 RepID=UPI0021AA4BE9|nr:uncharacterized protein LOC126907214 [Daktulosphaira vitifoliae]
MAEQVQLSIRRGQFKGQLSRFVLFVERKSGEENIDTSQIILRRDKILEVWQDYESVQAEIEELTGITEEMEKYREEMENIYFGVLAECDKLIKKLCSSDNISINDSSVQNIQSIPTKPNNINSQFGSSIIKLPPIDLPKFSGDYSEWQSYYDMFSTAINENNNLNNMQKFFYLRPSLSGEAAKVIQCLPTTSDKYTIAWQTLKERYSNTKLLVQVHTKSLFDLSPIYHESAEETRCFHDTLVGHIKALENLGQKPDLWGSLIIHLITSKLDVQSLRSWEIESPRSEVATLNNIIVFLESRFRMLEAIESSSKLQSNNNIRSFSKKNFIQKRSDRKINVLFTSGGSVTCYYCKQSHTIYRCPSFLKLTVNERINKIKQLNHCIICLRAHADEQICKARRCAKCGRGHNSLLHVNSKTDNVGNSDNVESIIDNKVPDNTTLQQPILTNAHTYQRNYNSSRRSVLLATAVVHAYNNKNEPVVCRVLLDSGSQNNFITESMAHYLKLKRKNVAYSVFGINESPNNVKHQVSAIIKSRVSDFKTNLNFLTLPKLTSLLPQSGIDARELKIPSDIILADPLFGTPQRIDMLIEAEIFFDLMYSDQIKTVDGPVIQKTEFGWIVSGPISASFTTSMFATTV